jgi:hypothetical protein
MTKEIVRAREKQLMRQIPGALKYKTLLYIGANAKRMQMLKLFIKQKYRIDIIEIWPENIAGLKAWNQKKKNVKKFYCADIRKFIPASKYDVIMWWHGPEHVRIEELRDILAHLEWSARHLVILASPWGDVAQEIDSKNPFEEHLAALYPKTWSGFGYKSHAIGKENIAFSNLLAWKQMK